LATVLVAPTAALPLALPPPPPPHPASNATAMKLTVIILLSVFIDFSFYSKDFFKTFSKADPCCHAKQDKYGSVCAYHKQINKCQDNLIIFYFAAMAAKK
jgi:hypothetical protein